MAVEMDNSMAEGCRIRVKIRISNCFGAHKPSRFAIFTVHIG